MHCGAGRDRLASGLCRQRESGEFCDVLIKVSDNMRITAHSNVLAISSIYFSDIARNPSSLLPYIPSTRIGGHVSLSVTVRTSLDGELFSTNPIPDISSAYAVSAAAEEGRLASTPNGFHYAQSEGETVKMDSVVFSVQETSSTMTALRRNVCDSDISRAVMTYGGAGDGNPTFQSLVNLPQSLVTVSFDGSSVDADLITIDASDIRDGNDSKQTISDASLSPKISDPTCQHSPVARLSRRNHKQSSYKYLLEIDVVDREALELSRLADCVRHLVDFAYCCSPLPITDATYPVLHDLAKLLQMEEAVFLCEKHAVDRLVGCSPEPPPTAEPEPEPERSQPVPGDSRLRVCRSCSFVCHSAVRMREHRRMHHVRSYMCGFCGVTRQKTSQLLRHLIHAEHGETVCSLCFHECGPGERIADHYLRHNDPRPFFCSVCFARFPSRTGLNLHMPTHSTVKPFVCHTCGQAFKWRHALQSHSRTHGAEKKLLCDVCGFCTRHTGQFKAHKARHAGTTEPCPHDGCTFRATTTWLLKDHLVTHAADKQYQCEVCGKKFGHVRNMRRHALLHGQRVALTCERCPYQTTRSDKLAQHVRVKHTTAAASEGDDARPSEPASTAAAGGQRSTTKRRRKGTAPPVPASAGELTRPAGRRLVPILPKETNAGPRLADSPRRHVRVRRLLPKPDPEGPAQPPVV